MAWTETDIGDALMVITNVITGNTTDVTTGSYKGVIVQMRLVEAGSSSTTDITFTDENGVDLTNGDAAFTNFAATVDLTQTELNNGIFCAGQLTMTTAQFTGTSVTVHVYILRMN